MDTRTPSFNGIMDREVTPSSIQFGYFIPLTLQVIWEAYPVQGPSHVSKLDMLNTYHRGYLHPFKVGSFAYFIPLVAYYGGFISCVVLSLLIGWVNPPKFLYDLF